MPLRISQTVIEARPIPSPAILSRNLATCGFGFGRIISETVFVSRSQATGAVTFCSHRKTRPACRRIARVHASRLISIT